MFISIDIPEAYAHDHSLSSSGNRGSVAKIAKVHDLALLWMQLSCEARNGAGQLGMSRQCCRRLVSIIQVPLDQNAILLGG